MADQEHPRQKIELVEMRMLRWMYGHTRSEWIRNEVIWHKVGVDSHVDKKEVRLRWFVHVNKRCTDAPSRRCQKLAIVGIIRGRGRPKKSWEEMIRKDTTYLQLTEDMTQDGKMWRLKIKVES